MELIEQKFPEVNGGCWSHLRDTNQRLYNLGLSEREMVLGFIFSKLANSYGGFHHFWKNAEGMKWVREAWGSALCDLNVNQILHGLSKLVNGETKYLKVPPKTPMEFYTVCKAGEGKRSDESRVDWDIVSERTPEVYQEAMKIIRNALGKKRYDS